MVYEEPKKMLLYGDACRVSTDPIAKASYFFDLIQVSLLAARIAAMLPHLKQNKEKINVCNTD